MEHVAWVGRKSVGVQTSWKRGMAAGVTVAVLACGAPAALGEGEYEGVPPILELTDEVKEPLISALESAGLDFADIEVVIIADGQGRLAALHPEAQKAQSFSVPESEFVIPGAGTAFATAAVVFESSPGTLVVCSPPSPRDCNSVP